MKHEKLLQDLGTKATFFGLGLLAAKKMRPYAKFFIIGGVAISAAPGVMAAVEQIKAKRSESQPVEEVAFEAPCTCCEEEAETECCCEEHPEEPAVEPCAELNEEEPEA